MPETPRLPTGYFGMMPIALTPPLWFHLMDPRVVAVADGRKERINIGKSGNKRLEKLIAAYQRGPEMSAAGEAVPA
jgi:alkane 1-monooxygenase